MENKYQCVDCSENIKPGGNHHFICDYCKKCRCQECHDQHYKMKKYKCCKHHLDEYMSKRIIPQGGCDSNAGEHVNNITLCTVCGIVRCDTCHKTHLNLVKYASCRFSKKESVNHPDHYGGDTVYEVIKVLEAWNLGFHLSTAIKYLPRAGKKDPAKEIEDLKKAVWYITRKITLLESEKVKP